MDCSLFLNIACEYERMHNHYFNEKNNNKCGKCPLYALKKKSKRRFCLYRVFERPQETMEIIQKWSDANPVETRMTLFLRNNPKAKLDENGLPLICAGDIYGFDCTNKNPIGCKKCWGEVLNNDKSL